MSTLKERIQEVIDAGFPQAELARLSGRSTSAVTQWVSDDAKPTATIHAKTAFALEKGTGFRAQWLISGQLPKKVVDLETSSYSLDAQKPSNSMQTLPVVEWGKGVEMLSVRNEVLARGGEFEAYTAPGIQSPQAKFFVVPDDAMAPDILRGEYVAMDPAPKPVRGDYVLVKKLSTGELMMRQFRPVDPDEFNAVPLNSGKFDPLNSKQHGLELLAVLVGHWSGRRSERQ